MIIDKTPDGDTVRFREMRITPADSGKHHVQLILETTLVDGSGNRSDIIPGKVVLDELIDRSLRDFIQNIRDEHQS